MGCFGSKQKIVSGDYTHVDNTADLKIKPGLFVLPKSGLLKNDYFLGQRLGAGSFGYVHFATHRTSGNVRAIKTVKKSKITSDVRARRKFIAEIEIMKRLDHPNIVKLYEFYEDDHDYHLVTEYLPGGELFDYIVKTKTLNELASANVMRQIFSAISYCHAHNIVHRDLKPENLLLTSKTDLHVKVIDFGTSGLYKANQKMKGRYGTSYFIAPEVIKGNYNELCDLWSCGVILYILLVGHPPFIGESDAEILANVTEARYSLEGQQWDHISAEAKDLVSKLLCKNVKSRISASQALNHPWIVQNLSQPLTTTKSFYSTLENLRTFRAGQKLQHAALTFIACQLISKEEGRLLTQAFQAIDTDGDGKISRVELLALFDSKGIAKPQEEVDRILEQVDVDGNGYIDYSEFLTATMNRDLISNKALLTTTFELFDNDGSGKISTEELKSLLGPEVKSRDSVWKELIAQVDKNGDGEIDLNEFKAMMIDCFKVE